MHKAQPGARATHRKAGKLGHLSGCRGQKLAAAVHLRPPTHVLALLPSAHRGSASQEIRPHRAIQSAGRGQQPHTDSVQGLFGGEHRALTQILLILKGQELY